MSTAATTGQVMEALGEVIDPELGINVVYGVQVAEDGTATLDLALTSPACRLTKVIEDQIRTALVGAGLVPNFRVNWVSTPAWTPARITADGRDQLQAIGFSL